MICRQKPSARHFALSAVGAIALSAAGSNLLASGSAQVAHSTPRSYRIDAAALPPPNATRSVDNGQSVVPRPPGARLYVAPGFGVALWASGLDNPREIVTAPNGDVLVAESRANRIRILRPGKSGRIAQRSVLVGGLRQPFGMAFYPPANPKWLYVANTDSIVRYPYRPGDLKLAGRPRHILSLPGGGYNQHWTRTIVFSPDGRKLYVAVGSRSNVGIEAPPRATIFVCDPDGSDRHTYASGLRNAVGLAFDPIDGRLWAAVNERDRIGDRIPPDFVTAVRSGGFYGWPYSYIGNHQDPRMPRRPDLERKAIVPDVLLPAHSAALTVLFGRGRFGRDAYVALHGSWNRRDPSGYEIVRVPLDAHGRALGSFQDFVWGWHTSTGKVWGRPVGLTFLNDGSMIVSDDGGNCLWRVTGGRG